MVRPKWTEIEIRKNPQSRQTEAQENYYSLGTAFSFHDEYWPILLTSDYLIYKQSKRKIRYLIRTRRKKYLVASVIGLGNVMTVKIYAGYWTRYGKLLKIKFYKNGYISIKGNLFLPAAGYREQASGTGKLYISQQKRLPFYLALLTVAMYYHRKMSQWVATNMSSRSKS